ncbi:uncharacterized protein PV06_06096 [Exophiala oligosperma]|uniref:G-patch domain-containing protein n=1 Tax=Exophiala oligosperma TaxID=215243 RepID=A0A0D2ARR3_9EURO|nr:uncharacterized protein PV06_06096 [Exophiala oligosperma]KIW42556.1 hypothetical protein PV06_06096 [Exophiala oligosperma]
MGLAEPKRRSKISHDPRNLSWSQSSTSFGQRIMTQQGWQEGQSLGNRESIHVGVNDADRLAAARVGVLFKNNNLGLGAKTKSQDVEGQRTGLDAFQGLLGRLNGKSDAELKKQEKKIEDRKLEMYARGRWGGLVFVKGGILEGSIKDKTTTKADKQDESDDQPDQTQSEPVSDQDGGDEKRRRREERKQRKEERRKRREEKASRQADKKAKTKEAATTSLPLHKSPLSQPPDEPVSSSSSENEIDVTTSSKNSKRGRSSTPREELVTPKSHNVGIKSGRHILRGRNIQAKRMAFSDMKGLDEIFMRPG